MPPKTPTTSLYVQARSETEGGDGIGDEIGDGSALKIACLMSFSRQFEQPILY
jgi:hypothetical protein